jgi:hypothetical protein
MPNAAAKTVVSIAALLRKKVLFACGQSVS